ncbi:MAG: flavodoxin family protein, partial [Candidatus Thorarchaeota archaeon]
MTKVMVINGSPRMEKGNTTYTLNPIIEGMRKAGAEVEIIYTKKQKIKPCVGCFKCWGETIGECFIQDDMQELYPKLKETDILVIATPVYIQLPGLLQNFMNRLCPLVEPLLEFRNGRTRVKFHDDVKTSKILGLVIGGWWEIENLDLVTKIIEELSENTSSEYVGTIRRPHASLLKQETEKNKEIISTLESIGHKLITEGKVNPKDLEFVSQPLIGEE